MTSEARNNRLPIPRPAVGNDRMFPALFSRIALEAIRAGGEDMPLIFQAGFEALSASRAGLQIWFLQNLAFTPVRTP